MDLFRICNTDVCGTFLYIKLKNGCAGPGGGGGVGQPHGGQGSRPRDLPKEGHHTAAFAYMSSSQIKNIHTEPEFLNF
jgi:hypothetical protein